MAWQGANPDKTRSYKRNSANKAYANNPEVFKARNAKARRANPVKSQFLGAKSRAKRLGIPFTVKLEDLELPNNCPVLGTPLVYECAKIRTDGRATLDRRDNAKGYVAGNVYVISWRANKLKANATVDEMRALVRYLERKL